MIYNKHDELLGRDLTAAERLEPQREELKHAARLLEYSIRDLERASNELTDEELEIIAENAKAVHALVMDMYRCDWGLKR